MISAVLRVVRLICIQLRVVLRLFLIARPKLVLASEEGLNIRKKLAGNLLPSSFSLCLLFVLFVGG